MSESYCSSVAHSHGTKAHNSNSSSSPINFTFKELSLFREEIPDGADCAQCEQFYWYGESVQVKGLVAEKVVRILRKELQILLQKTFC